MNIISKEISQRKLFFQGKLQDANKEFQNVKDASDELLLLDDDDVKLSAYKIGSVFIHMDKVSKDVRNK